MTDPAPTAAPTTAPAPSATATSVPASTAPAAEQPRQHADPDEVDISEHFYQPQTTARVPSPPGSNISDAQLRQMMLGFEQPIPPGAGTPQSQVPGMPAMPPGMEDDPMMRMMMQMMGGGGDTNGSNPFASMGGMGGLGGMGMPFPPIAQHQQSQPALPNRQSSLWRLLHTAIALALGLYIALYTPFTGTKLSRDRAAATAAGAADAREQLTSPSSSGSDVTKNFFWAFATAEAVLLGSRYFVERGRSRLAAASGNGVLGLVVGFLPGGIRSKVELAMRYGEVFGTVKGDVLVCVFVLGVAAWWRGEYYY
jgi:hypothetical protein